MTEDERFPSVPVGDAACWIGQLCPECGAVPEGEGAEDPRVPCWRCGEVRASHTAGVEKPPLDSSS